MNFEYRLGRSPEREARRIEESPLRILVMGDFSGRGLRGADDGFDLANRRAIAVDIDVYEAVFARIAPRLSLPAGPDAAATQIDFSRLDDFHPDALYERVPGFEALRDVRQRMQNPATFAEAAAAFRSGAAEVGGTAVEPSGAANRGSGEEDGATLERLLGRASPGGAQSSGSAPAPSGLDAFVRSIVAPYIVPDAPPHQAQYVASLDAAIGAQMNAILHAREFQSLESLWRGLYWLVSNLELGEELKLYVLDVTKRELFSDIQSAQSDLAASASYRLLADAAPGIDPLSLVVGNFEFGTGGEDVTLLASLGAIASHAGAPFLAGAKPEIAGCRSFAETPDPADWQAAREAEEGWQALRESAMAPWIGLAAPRMLLRLPYGKATDRIESFELEELAGSRQHESYLWGNPALACALLVARAFQSRGWEMEPGDELDVEDLPAHTFDDDGEKRLQACAEANLSERAGQALLERGIIPLLSYRNRNAIRVLRFQSIADPAQPLSGPWG
jgi:type VI secretion system protein ImpC